MNAGSSVLHRACPAKLNLGLQVVRRRDDGYHELDTVFQELELADDLWGCRSDQPGVHLEMSSEVGGDAVGREVVAGDDNLVVRAAQAVLDSAGLRPDSRGLRFALHKRIPAGAGLGGGSSDAAAALILTDALLGTGLAPERMASLAVGLGADVPFFLVGGTARGRGVGEVLERLPDSVAWEFQLLLPPFGCETVAVFRERARLEGTGFERQVHGVTYPGLGGPDGSVGPFRNDLEEPALRIRPELAKLRDALRHAGEGDACMSGSGSTLFVRRAREAVTAGPKAGSMRDWADRVRDVAERAIPGTVVLPTSTRRVAASIRPASWREPPDPISAPVGRGL